ncbi:translation machinery-associated protein 20 [Orbilia oligospora]|uniref:Translation machinery-associated protein 20 n=1 Tax=Orbilia oligospora TaxID=2813651 RepID=A0A6G1MKT2_ORBOL|nr:translation machinery-associated protein 20 [Orbilia oligospora]KAF3261774.1 translation machinery-associated protein 20 [Orbilia oligospora]
MQPNPPSSKFPPPHTQAPTDPFTPEPQHPRIPQDVQEAELIRVSSSGKTKIKSSVQRNIRQKICEQFPLLEPVIDDVLPKKAQLDLIKAPEKISLYALDNQVLFFQHHNDAIMPHLRIVHKYPQCFPTVQVDRGAIRFILGGAQLMCPGLTSPGAKLPPPEGNIPEGAVVAINAEGKEHACMIGVLKMSTEDIKRLNKGNGVENCHYLGDGLWKMDSE